MRKVAVVSLVAALLFVACRGAEKEAPGLPAAVARISDHFSLGEPVAVMNLTVWPVYTDEPLDVGEFLTLHEAIEAGKAEIREVSGGEGQTNDNGAIQQEAQIFDNDFAGQMIGGATVNTLVIENKGDLPILVCAGTLVKGGQQDRQIGEDLVIAANSTTPVPAFCVEQGRWTNDRMGEATAGKFVPAKANAVAPVRARGQYEKDQSGVWEEVSQAKAVVERNPTQEDFAVFTGGTAVNAMSLAQSSGLAVAHDANDEVAGKEVAKYGDAVRKHFADLGEQPVGFAYAVDGKPVGVRTFAHHRVFAKQFDPFVETMSAEAFLARCGRKEGETVPAAKAGDVVALVEEIEAANEEMAATPAGNVNGERLSDIGYNSNCYLLPAGAEAGEGRVVLTRDWTAK